MHLNPPWYSFENLNVPQKRQAVVVGAGIAGCSVAHFLAHRGWRVTVVERGHSVGSGASGNSAGALYPHIGIGQKNPTAKWSLESYAFFQKYLKSIENKSSDSQPWTRFFNRCGLTIVAESEKDQQRLETAFNSNSEIASIAQLVEPSEHLLNMGLSKNHKVLYLPDAGAIYPKEYFEYLMTHPQIECEFEFEVKSASRKNSLWQVESVDGHTIEAPILILANSFNVPKMIPNFCGLGDSVKLNECLPLYQVRGQMHNIEPDALSADLKTVLIYGGYLTPLKNGKHAIGATFDWKSKTLEPRQSDFDEVIGRVRNTFPQIFNSSPIGDARVSFRATCPDTLSIVGPIPQWDYFIENYADIKHGRTRQKFPAARWSDGLFVTTGHGSRGMLYGLYAGYLLAGLIDADTEVVSLQRENLERLSPARFLIRQLRMGRNFL